jgi:hypothetical protein
MRGSVDEVFAALDAAKFPDDFLSDADRDRRPLEDRPELDLAIGPTTEAAMEDACPEQTSEMVRKQTEEDLNEKT